MNEFTIHVPQSDLDDLQERLARTRWPDELPEAGWDYGIPLDRVRSLAATWAKLDWRAHEERLNAYPQFVDSIDGENVYFLHVRSTSPDAIPLVLTHGWPGSVIEFLDLIPLLTDHFHLVVPAIPGYGFSGPTHAKGWGVKRIAAAWATLMARLGYDRYGAQGGDFGAGVSRILATIAPEQVIGVHLNFMPTPGTYEGTLSPADQARMEKTRQLAANRHPHQVLFARAPQTLAYALTDSPAGQLAFIAEKFTEWADPNHPIPDETIVTDVAHYWLTRTAASSSRLIKETGLIGAPPPAPAPLAVAVLPHDIVQPIRPLAERDHNLHQWTELPRGGHFAALEVPDLLAPDITTFFRGLPR